MDFLPLPSLTHFVHTLRADVSFPTKNKVRVAKKPVHNCVFNNTINLQIHVNLQRRSLVSKIMKSVCPPKYKSSFGLFAIPMQTIVNEIDENNVL